MTLFQSYRLMRSYGNGPVNAALKGILFWRGERVYLTPNRMVA